MTDEAIDLTTVVTDKPIDADALAVELGTGLRVIAYPDDYDDPELAGQRKIKAEAVTEEVLLAAIVAHTAVG